MVEFALVLPILLMVILGIIEFGRLMFIYSAVTSSSRDASRYGASIGLNPNGRPRYADCEAIRAQALNIGQIVGVDPGDVYITYDYGPETPVGPGTPQPTSWNCPQDVSLGDRIIVEVRGDYNPLPAMPLVGLLSYQFISISRRTIIKDAPIQQAGTSVGAIFTDTPLVTATIDITTTPTITLTPSITPTFSGATATPSYTPTPVPPAAPVFVSITWTPFGQKCNDVILTWSPNPNWTSNPGFSPSTYQVYKNGFSAGTITPADPSNTVWETGDQVNDNSRINYEVKALFAGPLSSDVLLREYLCQNGSMVDVSPIPNVNIDITVPGIDGVTITNLTQTRFEASAWDTTVGTNNGDGIQQVEFEITGPGGILVIVSTEFFVAYCAFGANGPCDVWDASASTSFASAPDGVYTIRARALSDLGIYTPWETRTFTLAKSTVNIEFVFPGVDGVTITDISQTRFEVIAWDTAVGTINGYGIQDTFFEIIGPGGIVILSGVHEAHLRYCIFKGHEPCDVWDGEASTSFADAPNGTYTIRARALSDSGIYTPWITRTFILAK